MSNNGCLQAPPPKITLQQTLVPVAWWSCVKCSLKYSPRDRMLIQKLWDLICSSIHWFLKRMNPLGVRKKDSITGCCFFHKTWLHQGLLIYPQTDQASTFNLYTISLTNSFLRPLTMSFLQYQSLACCSFKALSQEIFPLLALASTSMQMTWYFSTL